MNKYITIKSFRNAVEAHDTTALDKTVTKDFKIKNIASTDGVFTFVITTNAMDRSLDIVDPNGLDIANYLNNPVVLKIHDDKSWPIGKCTGLTRTEDGWLASVEFVPSDYPVVGQDGEFCRRALVDGFISAVSIGFRALDYTINDAGGMTITESELLEFSIVPIPCNPEALLVPSIPLEYTDAVEEKASEVEIKEVDIETKSIEEDITSEVIAPVKKINRKRLKREVELAKTKARLK